PLVHQSDIDIRSPEKFGPHRQVLNDNCTDITMKRMVITKNVFFKTTTQCQIFPSEKLRLRIDVTIQRDHITPRVVMAAVETFLTYGQKFTFVCSTAAFCKPLYL